MATVRANDIISIGRDGVRHNLLRIMRGGVQLFPPSGTGTAPVNTALPVIAASGFEGFPLTHSGDTWTGNPAPTFTYQWQRSTNGGSTWTNISGATGASYTPVTADADNQVRLRKTATNASGSVTVSSNASGISAAGVPAATLLSGATRPSQPQAEPTDLIPSNARNFNSGTPWGTGFTGVTFGSTGVVFDGSNATQQNLEVTLSTPMVAGRTYGITFGFPERTAGTVTMTATTPGSASPNVNGSFTAVRNYTRSLTATAAHTRLRVSIGGAAAGRANYVHVYDMTDMLTLPWRILFIFDAQSNVVGNAATDVDWAIDTPDPRVIYIPSTAITGYGTAINADGAGNPLILQDPLQHATQNLGGGPMGSVAKAVADGLRNTERLVVVSCGWAGTGRLNAGLWNRENDPPGAAWTNMITQMNAVLARAPAGSTVIGAIQCGHEADVSVNAPTLLPAAIKSDIDLLRASYGNFPVVMMEMGLNGAQLTTNAVNTMAGLAKMDSASGDPLAHPLVKYVPRPAGAAFMPDDVHYNQATNRLRGTQCGNALLDLLYGTSATVAPTNTAAPVVAGGNAVGATLTHSGDTWTGSPAPTFAHQWQRQRHLDQSNDPLVIFVTGQSNALLRAGMSWTPPSNLKLWNFQASLTDAQVGTYVGSFLAPAQFSSFMTYAGAIGARAAEMFPARPVYVIMVARGTQPISQWEAAAPDPRMWAAIQNNVPAALAAISAETGQTVDKIDCAFWWQGERDAFLNNTAYAADFSALHTRFKAQSWWPEYTQIVLSGLTPYNTANYASTFNTRIQSAVSAEPATRLFYNPGALPRDGNWDPADDYIHMTAAGYQLAGQGAWNALTAWANIGGATAASYPTISADGGQQVRLRKIGTNSAGSATAFSNPVSMWGDAPIAGTLTNPPVSARLGIINERSARPFINAFKQAWEWEGNNAGGNWAALRSANLISDGGQILAMPGGTDAGIRTRALDSLIAESGATGRWRLTWTGAGAFEVIGGSNVTQVNASTIEFDYTANGASWVTVIARSAPISNIKLVHEDDWAADAAGAIFRQQYLDEVRNYRCLRFDEWTGILRDEPYGLAVTTWASRPLPTDETFLHRFVPLEWQAALCNEVGADFWMCTPTAATEDYDTGAATLVRSLVPAPRHVYPEYSTKTWDFAGTPQAHYCAEQGRIAFGTTGNPTEQEFRSWYGMRSALMAQRWRAVWGADPRLHVVIQHQADWVGGEYDVLVAPMWQERDGTLGLPPYVAPHSVCDVLTVHAQIDGGMAYGSAASLIETWRTTLSQTEAFNRMRDQMLTGPYHNPGDDGRRTVQLLTPKWQHYRTVADGYGMELASYEVGNHLNGVGGSAAMQTFVHAFSASAQMGEVYAATFAAIRAAGFDGPLAMAVECRYPDSNICHGLQRWLGDHNGAWTAVEAINLGNDGPAGRGAGDFVGAVEVA